MGRRITVEVTDPVGARVEAARLRRGLSRDTAAALAGTTAQTWRFRCADGQWRTRYLAAIAAVLRVRVEDLTGVE